jgi:hypothetical protein
MKNRMTLSLIPAVMSQQTGKIHVYGTAVRNL